MLAARLADVDDLNRRARRLLDDAGLRPGDAVTVNGQIIGSG